MKFRRWLFSEYSTTQKAYNLLLAGLQWRFLKNSKLITYPAKMTICPGNVCNLHCVLCPAGQNDKGRKQGLMDFGLFKKIIDECGPYIYELSLFNWGEPLLNKEIFNMVRYAKNFKIKVIISTNLKKFDETICSQFVHSGLDVLIVSLDGASQQSVSQYQAGNNFEEIIANMKELVDYKKKRQASKPSVQWRFLVNRYNEHEIDQARLISKKIGADELRLDKFRCDMGSELLLDNAQQFSNVKKWLPQNESLSMYDYSKKEKKKNKLNHCRWLWFQSSVNWNGSISPCCAVWNEKFDFGNVRHTSFAAIWNCAQYKEARKIVRGDDIQTTDNICAICHSNKAII